MTNDKLRKEQHKLKIKQNKLESDMKRASIEVEYSRETTKKSMEQSYFDLEVWKEKELLKGKNPEKVEKKYQKGLKVLKHLDYKFEKFNDKMETKIDVWEYKNNLKLEIATQKKIIGKISTSSLSKMERILVNDPESELKYMIAGFCATSRREELNILKHPNLIKEVEKWDEAIIEANKTNEYYKMFLYLIETQNEKEKKLLFKIRASKKINKIIEEEKISIRFLSEYTGLKYSNVYNFLKKEIYTDLSFKKAHQLLWILVNLKKGWAKEEAMIEYFENIKKVKEYWDEDLLN